MLKKEVIKLVGTLKLKVKNKDCVTEETLKYTIDVIGCVICLACEGTARVSGSMIFSYFMETSRN